MIDLILKRLGLLFAVPFALLLLPATTLAAPDAWFAHASSSPTAVTFSCAPSAWGRLVCTPSVGATGSPAPAAGASLPVTPVPACGWWAPCTGRTPESPVPTPSSSPSGGTSLSGAAAQFLAMVNSYRNQNGLGPLEDNPTLDAPALAKAEDQVRNGYIAHDSPTLGWSIDQEIRAENIAAAGSIQRALWNLENDPGHRANLLDPVFTQTGIAVVPVPYGVLVDEFFSGPLE